MESSNDDVSLESTVLTAMVRLQGGKSSCRRQRKCSGVSWTTVVTYLKNNCSWIDGDIKSQVMTTLLSCVKTGLVCALDCGKYCLVDQKAKNMVSSCETRISHGPSCSCLKVLKTKLKSFRSPCCVLKDGKRVEKSEMKATSKTEMKTKVRAKRKSGKKMETKASKVSEDSKAIPCALKAEETIDNSKKANGKFTNCLALHSSRRKSTVCKNCNCLGAISSVPVDKFSPGDHPRSERLSECWK